MKNNKKKAVKKPAAAAKKSQNAKGRTGLWILIAALAVVLVAAVIFLCVKLTQGSPADKGGIVISEDYSHVAPEDLENDGYITMKSQEGFLDILTVAGLYAENGEPLYYYDRNGDAVGRYLYDENGWVYAWKSDDGTVTNLPEDEQFDAPFILSGGEPLLMAGDVKLHFLVYVKDQSAVTTYMYYILSDASDMDTFLTAMSRAGLGTPEKVSDTVAVSIMDATAIGEEMTLVDLEYDLTDYLSWLGQTYGVAR